MNIPERDSENLLTERQVASLLSISVATLRRWRSHGQPPAWTKLGTSVRYLPCAVREFIQEGINVRGRTPQLGGRS